MDFPISVPSIGLVDGKFVDEDPLSGQPGSLIPSAWGNSITIELLNVIEAAGLDPSETELTQLLQSIRLLNKQPGLLADTGAANTYTATNAPVLTALPSSGYVQRIVIANTNTGPATYAPDGLAAKPIYGLGLQPLQGGELPAGLAMMMYLVQPGVNGGNGAWIIIESLGGAQQITQATKSLHAVQFDQILKNYAWNKGFQALTASGNFTVPAGVYWLDVEGWGGGGGGGGSSTGGGTAGGGGPGGYFRKLLAVTPGQVIPYAIGAGGNPGGLGGSGTAGGATTFSLGSLSAGGGGAGLPNPSGNSGAGGVASGGDINISGAAGSSGAASNVQGGSGGQVPGGGGSSGSGAQGAAGSGTIPGGAGGGGGSNSTGGSGARGQVNVRW